MGVETFMTISEKLKLLTYVYSNYVMHRLDTCIQVSLFMHWYVTSYQMQIASVDFDPYHVRASILASPWAPRYLIRISPLRSHEDIREGSLGQILSPRHHTTRTHITNTQFLHHQRTTSFTQSSPQLHGTRIVSSHTLT